MSYERYLALDLIARLAERFGPVSRVAQELPSWLEFLTTVECPERPHARPGAQWWREIRQISRDLARNAEGTDHGILKRNCQLLGDHFRLTPTEVGILAFVAHYHVSDEFEHVVDGALQTKEVSVPLLLSWYCDASEQQLRTALSPSGRLIQSGLLQVDRHGSYNRIPYDLSRRLLSALRADVSSVEAVISLLFPAAAEPEAEWQDFEGLGQDAVLIRELTKRALASRTAGVNILLYGPPGTGKTEFAKVLAQEVQADLRAIGEKDEDGGELTRRERLTEMGLACRMLGARSDTILLFDEMEDLFGGANPFSGHDRPSKVFANRMLETNPIPVIWTTNSVEACDPAFLRRMSYSALIRPPSGRVRTRIWQRLEARHGAGLTSESLTGLAARHPQAPALVSDALRLARLCNGGEAMVDQVLNAAARLARGGVDAPPYQNSEAPWQPDLANTDMDLAKIETRLAAKGAPRQISFCLYGAPGTGKSAWARHLAKTLDMPVLQKRASDLISKWLGESEKNIARAFAEARSDGALLIFDEADSLLQDRRNAQHSWEVSQVNEMLTWMESHPLPFVCTTNLVQNLDPATQRRFTFRIRFGNLADDQLIKAWRAYFTAEVPTALTKSAALAPGDFPNVARRMCALGETRPEEILRELMREAMAKQGTTRPIGFVH